MTKMEALREVNDMLTEVLDKIETQMFVENINIVDDKKTDDVPNMLFENKNGEINYL